MHSRRPLLLCAALLLTLPATVQAQWEMGPPSTWNIGASVGTWAGPSHADLLFRINEIMPLLGDDSGNRLTDFDRGSPISVRLRYNVLPEIAFSATYSISDYASETTFLPSEWTSPRKLDTNLHEIGVALHYGLDFVRNQQLMPYVGFGVSVVVADSELAIDLINTPGAPIDDPENPYPGQSFLVTATDQTLAYFGMAGLTYRLTNRLSFTAEIQGIMGDLRQTFEYAGSWQYINPDDIDPLIVNDPRRNDILLGVYPLDLNGIRLSIGFLVGL